MPTRLSAIVRAVVAAAPLVVLVAACGGGADEGVGWPQGGDAYTFDRPDTSFALPARLREVSGLTLLDDLHLGAVQDEQGNLYVLHVETGEVVREAGFGRPGDYEGIERVGDRLFILRSDGALFEVEGWRAGGDLSTVEHETGLPGTCDAEGLGYQAEEARLLIACKEGAGKKPAFKDLYSFDPATGRMDDEPAYLLDVAAFNRSVPDDNAVDRWLRDVLQSTVDLSGFKPSALAVHPVTGELYVLSSVRRAVVALAPSGEVTAVWPLSEALLQQPEGLAFLPDGDLFVSSEGGGGDPAVLLRFDYRP